MKEIGSAAMLVTKRLACVTPEVNLRDCVTLKPLPSTNKASQCGFKLHMICHQNFKKGISVAQQKDLCPPKLKKYIYEFNLDINVFLSSKKSICQFYVQYLR